MRTALFDSIQFLNGIKHSYTHVNSFKIIQYIDLAKLKSRAPIFTWQSYYSQRKIKIEPRIKLNHNIYMSVPSSLKGGNSYSYHHIVAMGSSSEPSYLRNPITSTDKLLGHISFMGKVFNISSHNHIQHVI